MGVVYRGHDEQLEREVAIKVLPPGSLSNDDARRRFRKEALALARFNHPNIATIFEFGTDDGRDFLVTEYIAGTTLSDRLAQGPLESAEFIHLATQLATGLGAAHAEDLIHRDLKPGNLIVTPDGRLKILDFGLAQITGRVSDLGLTTTMTRTQQVGGTLPYMAPEQLRGVLPDARSDLWAVGCVIYEMATAKRPFSDETPAILIDAILNKDPIPASKQNPAVPSGLDRIVSKSLEKNVDRRYQSAADLRMDLEQLASNMSVLSPRKFWIALIAAISVGLVVAGCVSGWLIFRNRTRVPEVRVPHRRAVAVLGFKNLGGDQSQAWLSTALSEMLTTEIAAGNQLRTIPGENVSTAKFDLKLPEAESFGLPTLTKLDRILGADIVVLGTYIDLGGQMRVDVHIEDASGNNTVAEETGTQSKLFDLVQRLGAKIRQECGIGAVTAEDANSIQASLPHDPEAAKLYSEGLARLRSYDAMPASDLLSEAIKLDPEFALAHEALAETWSQLGYDNRAKEESRRAYDLSSGLPRREAVSIEAKYREDSREWSQAVQLYRSLWTVFADDPEYGLKLAGALTSAGNGRQALEVVKQLRQLAAPMRDDPRIDLAAAAAARSLSDYQKDASASVAAINKAAQRGSNGLRAEGLLQECWALRNLGEAERAKSAGGQAGEVLAGIGDLRGQARSLTCIGNVLDDQGQFQPARKMHEQALDLARKVGSQKDVAGALINLGNDLWQQSLTSSASKYKEALALALSIGDKTDALLAQGNLAAIAEMQGDFHAAQLFDDESVRTAEEIGDAAGMVQALTSRAEIFYLQGNLRSAKQDLQQAIEKARQLQLNIELANALVFLGDTQLAQDDVSGAQSSFEESLKIRKQAGEAGAVANSEVELARLAFENHQGAQAAAFASEAVHEFEVEHDADQQTAAENVLAEALISESKLVDASVAITTAQKLHIRDLPTTMPLDITAARLLAKNGRPIDAERQLQEIEKRAEATGSPELAWEARLAMAEVETASGRDSAARARLDSLQREAAPKGYLLLARKASELEKSLHKIAKPTAKAEMTLFTGRSGDFDVIVFCGLVSHREILLSTPLCTKN